MGYKKKSKALQHKSELRASLDHKRLTRTYYPPQPTPSTRSCRQSRCRCHPMWRWTLNLARSRGCEVLACTGLRTNKMAVDAPAAARDVTRALTSGGEDRAEAGNMSEPQIGKNSFKLECKGACSFETAKQRAHWYDGQPGVWTFEAARRAPGVDLEARDRRICDMEAPPPLGKIKTVEELRAFARDGEKYMMHQYIILESTFISTKEHIGTIEVTPYGDKCFCSYDATFQSG